MLEVLTEDSFLVVFLDFQDERPDSISLRLLVGPANSGAEESISNRLGGVKVEEDVEMVDSGREDSVVAGSWGNLRL